MTDLSYVKKIVHSLIVSSPLRMTVEKLNRDYAEMEGTPVPFKKLGYKDINSFLCNIPDTVIVTGSGPMAMVYARAKDKTAHIQSLVQGQKKPTKKLKSSWRGKPRYCYASEQSNILFVNQRANYNNNGNNWRNRRNNNNMEAPNQNFGYNRSNSSAYAYQYNAQFSKPLNTSCQDNGSRNFTQTTDVMTKSFAKLNMDTLENDENEYWSSDDDGVVLTVPYKKPIDYQSSDESCDDDAIPAYAVDEKVLRISRPKSSEQCFPKICIDLTNESDDEQVKETETPSSAQLPTLAINQAAVTQQTKECIVEAKKEGVKTAYIEYVSSDEGNDSDAIPAYAVDDIVISMDYPKDAVRFDHRMPKRNVQECMDLSERPLVQLINVSTPHDFYFWILGEEFEKFSAMTRNMQQFYRDVDDKKYSMPTYLIMVGHLVVVQSINQSWERAQILNIKTGHTKNIELELIDFGERMWVSHKDLKFLCKEFAVLPAQCMLGRLACITPRQGPHFSLEACNYFYELVSYRWLYAKIEKINAENNTVYLVLVDPISELFMSINTSLIESGLVRRCYNP
ncbi:uncharacterized protein LOC108594810 [Drosophila busckii]|uniref:uncharacterized protein LOC108594810 n=1 Tax=Drosophila busckii TaxID=30019 RepID=UPI00083F41B3|nr:uncharacterized protein LOC108594810 [Drosophila busckii]